MVRSCPKCKTNEYNCRNLVMMINECGHPLCKNCVENIFARNANVCPYNGCGKTLKKNNFWEQVFDDPRVERENAVRKRLDKIFNLQEDNFGSLREYNDYLEHVEDIVHKLVNEIDVEQVEEEIKHFKEVHADIIERNRKRLTADDVWINKMLNEEANRAKRLKAEVVDDKSGLNAINPKAIIDELRQSDLPAEVVLDRQRKIQIEAEMAEKEEAKKKKMDKLQRQRRMQSETVSFTPLRVSGKAYNHVVPVLKTNGPRLPTYAEIEQGGYLKNVAQAGLSAMAGGYISHIGCSRALFDAYQDLFVI